MLRRYVSIGLLLVLAATFGLGLVASARDSGIVDLKYTIVPAGPSELTATQPTTSRPATQPARRTTVSRAKLEAAEKARRKATKIVESLATAKSDDLPGIEKALADLGEVSMVPLKLAALSDNFELRRRADRLVERLRWRLVTSETLLKKHPKLIDVMSGSDAKAREAMVEKVVVQTGKTDYDDRRKILEAMRKASVSSREELVKKLLAEAGPSVSFLGECLADSQIFVRQRAIDGLINVAEHKASKPRIAKLLENCLDDDDLNMRLLAVAAMAKIRAVSVNRLAEMLDDESLEVRTSVIKAIGVSGKAPAAVHLTPLLKDRQWRIRAAALAALGQLLDSENARLAGDRVAELLTDEDKFVQGLATKLMGQWGWKKAAPVILKLLKQDEIDEESGFRALAAQQSHEAKTEMLRRYDASSGAARRFMLLDILDAYDPDVDVDARLTKAIADEAMKSQWPQVFELGARRRRWKEYFPRIAVYMLHADKTVAKGAWDALRYRVDDALMPDEVTRKLMASTEPQRVTWAMLAHYTYRSKEFPDIVRRAVGYASTDVVVLALGMIGSECIGDALETPVPEYRRDRDEGPVISLMPKRRDTVGKKPPVRIPADLVEPLAALLKHGEAKVSTRAAALLYRSGARNDKSVTEILRNGLKSKQVKLRLVAMTGIAEKAKPFLKDFDLVAAARSGRTSRCALEIIAHLGDPAYMPVLVELGRKATYEDERLMQLLIRSGDKQAAEVVFEKFKQADRWDIQRFVKGELSGMRGPGVVKFVDWALKKERRLDRDVFQILLTLSDPSAKDVIRSTIKRAEKTKQSDAGWVRAAGVVRLAQLDPKGMFPELRKMLLSDQQYSLLDVLTDAEPSDEIVKLLLDVAQKPDIKISSGWQDVVYWLPDKAVREQFIPVMSKLNWLIQQQLMNRLAGALGDKDLDSLLAASVDNAFLQEYLAAMIGVLTTEPSSRRPDLAGLKPESLRGILNAAGDWDNGAEVIMPFVNDTRPPVVIAARRALAYYALGRREAKLGAPCRDALLAAVTSADGIGAYLAAEALAQRWPEALAALRSADVTTTAAGARLAVAKGPGLSEAMRARLTTIIARRKGATGLNLAIISAAQDYDKSLNINIRMLNDHVSTRLLARVAAAAKNPEMVTDLLYEGPETLLRRQGDLESIVRKLIDKSRTGDSDLFATLAASGWIGWAGPRPGDFQRVIDHASRLTSVGYDNWGEVRSSRRGGLSLALSWAPPAGQVDAKVVKQISSAQTSGLLAAAVAAVRWNMPEGRKALRDAVSANLRSSSSGSSRGLTGVLRAAVGVNRGSSSSGSLRRWATALEALAICMTPEDAKALLDSVKPAKKDEDQYRLVERLGLLVNATASAAPRETLAAIDRLAGGMESYYRRSIRRDRGSVLVCLVDEWPLKSTGGSGRPAKDVGLVAPADDGDSSRTLAALQAARDYAAKRDSAMSVAVVMNVLMPPWRRSNNLFMPAVKTDAARQNLKDIVGRIKKRAVRRKRRGTISPDMLDQLDLDSVSPRMRRMILERISEGEYSNSGGLFSSGEADEDDEFPDGGLTGIVPLVLPAPEIAKALGPLLADKDQAIRRDALRIVAQWRVSHLAPEVARLVASDDVSEAMAASVVLGQLQGFQAIEAVATAYKRQKDFINRVRFACVLRQLGSEIGRADLDRAIALKTTRQFRLKFVSMATGSEDSEYRLGRSGSLRRYGLGRRRYRPRSRSDRTIGQQMLPWLSDLQEGAADLLAAENKRFCLPPGGLGEELIARSPRDPLQCDLTVLYINRHSLSPAKLVTNYLPLTPLAGASAYGAPIFAALCAAEQDLEPFFYVQFADRAANLAELHAKWLVWWSANKNKPRDEWWRQGLTQAVGELTHKRWWLRLRAVRRLMRLTGRTVTPPGVFDTKGWQRLQETWRAKLANRNGATHRQWLLAAAVEAGAVKDAATAANDDEAYLDVLVQLAGLATGPLAEAACLRLETWPDHKQLVRHSLPWQGSPRRGLRDWAQRAARILTGKQRLLYTCPPE